MGRTGSTTEQRCTANSFVVHLMQAYTAGWRKNREVCVQSIKTFLSFFLSQPLYILWSSHHQRNSSLQMSHLAHPFFPAQHTHYASAPLPTDRPQCFVPVSDPSHLSCEHADEFDLHTPLDQSAFSEPYSALVAERNARLLAHVHALTHSERAALRTVLVSRDQRAAYLNAVLPFVISGLHPRSVLRKLEVSDEPIMSGRPADADLLLTFVQLLHDTPSAPCYRH